MNKGNYCFRRDIPMAELGIGGMPWLKTSVAIEEHFKVEKRLNTNTKIISKLRPATI